MRIFIMNLGQRVTVVLVTFNRLEKLKIALSCYEKQTYKIEKIIIVDNCSTDGTIDFLKKWLDSKTNFDKEVVYLSENTGGAGGFGAGMEHALNLVNSMQLKTDWILVSDDDAFPNDDAIEKMIAYYQKQEVEKQNEIVALSSAVVNHGQIHESHRSRIEKDFFRIRFVGVDKKYYNTDGFEIDLFSYVGTMIKVSALKNVGTTLRDLFIYGDDNEHSLRLGKIGKLVCVPASVFVHDTPGVETRKIGWHNYYNRRNQLYILKEYFPLRYFINRFFKRYILDISILSKNTSEEKKLFKTAQMDALKNKLGKHPVYKPGFVIKEK